MLDQIFATPSVDCLTRGLNAANIRQNVIAENIANVNTPLFKKSEVIFEDLLARELAGDDDGEGKLQMVRTHPKHLPPKKFSFRAAPVVQTHEELTMRTDKNNVDIDEEMAHLAENQLYYQSMSRSLNTYLGSIKNAIASKS